MHCIHCGEEIVKKLHGNVLYWTGTGESPTWCGIGTHHPETECYCFRSYY